MSTGNLIPDPLQVSKPTDNEIRGFQHTGTPNLFRTLILVAFRAFLRSVEATQTLYRTLLHSSYKGIFGLGLDTVQAVLLGCASTRWKWAVKKLKSWKVPFTSIAEKADLIEKEF